VARHCRGPSAGAAAASTPRYFAGLKQNRDTYSGVLVDDREVVPAGIPGEPARVPEAACHACTVTTVGPSTRVQRRLPT
jgi:hypothetical protein